MNCEITLVTLENLKYFENMIPKKQKEDILWQDTYVILGAIVENTAVGVVVLGMEDGSAQVKWIYVAEEYRNKKIATALLHQIDDGMRNKGIGTAMACYNTDEYGYFLDHIFINMGYEIEAIKSYHYSFSIRELVSRPNYQNAVKKYKEKNNDTLYLPLGKVPDYIIRSSKIYSEYKSYNYHPKLSAVAVKENKVVGYLFIRENSEGNFYVEMLEIFETNPMHTLYLICASSSFLKDMITENSIDLDANFSFQNVGSKGLGFAKRIFLVDPTKTVWFHCARNRL